MGRRPSLFGWDPPGTYRRGAAAPSLGNMRIPRLLLALAATAALAGCGGDREEVAQPAPAPAAAAPAGSPDERAVADTLERYAAAVRAGDARTICSRAARPRRARDRRAGRRRLRARPDRRADRRGRARLPRSRCARSRCSGDRATARTEAHRARRPRAPWSSRSCAPAAAGGSAPEHDLAVDDREAHRHVGQVVGRALDGVGAEAGEVRAHPRRDAAVARAPRRARARPRSCSPRAPRSPSAPGRAMNGVRSGRPGARRSRAQASPMRGSALTTGQSEPSARIAPLRRRSAQRKPAATCSGRRLSRQR